jgi:hypothetical protein
MNNTESKPSFAAFLAAHAGAIVRATTDDVRSSFDTDYYGTSYVVEIWDGAKVQQVTTHTSGHTQWSGIDPVRWSETPDEVHALYQQIKPDLSEANRAAAAQIYRDSVLAAAATITETVLARQINQRLEFVADTKDGWKFKGLDATVVKGRKVAKGTKGRFFWHGESQYGFRAGLNVNGNTVWIAAANLSLDISVELRDLACAAGLGAVREAALDLIAQGGYGPIGNTVRKAGFIGSQNVIISPESHFAALAYTAAERVITDAAQAANKVQVFAFKSGASQSAPRD